MMALAPGVASSVAPKGIRVGPTGPAGPMPSGDVTPKGSPGEMLGACACAAPQTNSAVTSTIVKRVLMASALFSPSERDGPARRNPQGKCNLAARTSLCPDCRNLLDPAPLLAFQWASADGLSGSKCACASHRAA